MGSATNTVPSQTSKQWAGNISTEILNGNIELSLEGYYKTMDNLGAYKAGYSNLSNTEPWQSVETGGKGESYGTEFLFQRKREKQLDG